MTEKIFDILPLREGWEAVPWTLIGHSVGFVYNFTLPDQCEFIIQEISFLGDGRHDWKLFIGDKIYACDVVARRDLGAARLLISPRFNPVKIFDDVQVPSGQIARLAGYLYRRI